MGFVAVFFCVVFITHISLDIVTKNDSIEKKESLAEKEAEDSKENSPVKEKEADSEQFEKAIHYIAQLKFITQYYFVNLHRQQLNGNLPKGFYKTFTPPPDQLNNLVQCICF